MSSLSLPFREENGIASPSLEEDQFLDQSTSKWKRDHFEADHFKKPEWPEPATGCLLQTETPAPPTS